MSHYDVIVIGGGIAGVSVGYQLSKDRNVCLLEMESTLAFHTTGRSAATYLESYGGPAIRALTTGSRAFFEEPGEFWDSELLTARGLLAIVRPGQEDIIAHVHADVSALVPVELLESDEVERMYPILRPGFAARGMYEPGATEIDVASLHQGYVRGMRANKAEIVRDAAVVDLSRGNGVWTVVSADGVTRTAAAVVNAAGAWGDVVANLAGAKPVGLIPMRRTLFMVNSPDGGASENLPIVGDLDGTFYIKPDGPQFLCSPAEETPMEPHDVSPEPEDIAKAIDVINEATLLDIRSVNSSWAGLRTFVPDRNFVLGPDPELEDFHWHVGQGGYGIQTADAACRTSASLIRGEGIPEDLAARGLTLDMVSADRPDMHVPAGH